MASPPPETDRGTPGRGLRVARTVLALVLGAAHAATFSPPLDAWWLQLLLLAAFFVLLRSAPRPGPRQSALLAGAFGLSWFGTGLSWLHTSMHVYGGMPSPLAVIAVILLALYLASYVACAAALCARLAGQRWALGIAGCWGIAEMLRGYVFTGFPWLATGYAHVEGPLAGFAPWVGAYGVGAIAALVAALGAGAVVAALDRAPQSAVPTPQRGGRSAPATAGALPRVRAGQGLAPLALGAVVLLAGAAAARIEHARPVGAPLSVRLVQGNVAQRMKFDAARIHEAMRGYVEWVERGSAALTVLPETAWTVPWEATPPALVARLAGHLARDGGAIALGLPMFEAGGPAPGAHPQLTNSVALLVPDAAASPPAMRVAGRYDKRHLVPFGEFVPPGFGWFVRMMHIPLGDFARGAAQQPPFEVGGQRLAFNICYEDLFGEELLVAIRPPGRASVLVNVSNIAWFGDSQALPQHLAIARMRTLETARPMLRATNTGVTAAIDHRGNVLARLPTYEVGALEVRVQGTDGLTPYARLGNAAPVALALVLLGASALPRARPAGGPRADDRQTGNR